MNEYISHPDDPVKWADEQIELRIELYNLYGDHVFESLEGFCDRMADRYGENWTTKLKRNA